MSEADNPHHHCPDCNGVMFEIDYNELTQVAEWQCWDCELVQYFKDGNLVETDPEFPNAIPADYKEG